MSVDVTNLVMQRYFINELKRKIQQDNERLYEMWAKLKRQCTHPTVVVDRKYDPGGYDYVSSVTISKKCTLCDAIVECYNDPSHKGTYS